MNMSKLKRFEIFYNGCFVPFSVWLFSDKLALALKMVNTENENIKAIDYQFYSHYHYHWKREFCQRISIIFTVMQLLVDVVT